MKYGLPTAAIGKIRTVLAQFPQVDKAVLYGSRAKGNFKPGSDIDLSLFGENLTSSQLGEIAGALDDLLLPYTIDLSLYSELNHAKLREHIDRVGVVFYERRRAGEYPGDAAVKKGWEIKTLGEVCTVVNGGTPKTGVPEFWDGKHRWITPAEMGKRLSPYVGETERMISDLGLRNSSARMLPPHSVILSSRAPIGHLVINTEPMATNQGCKGLIPRSQLQHTFLYYYLSSIVDLLNSLGTGATFKELSGGKLKEVEIPVPPLPEQQRIVGILDEAFAGLATATANAEKNLQNARAIFESHLNDVFTQPDEAASDEELRRRARPSGHVADYKAPVSIDRATKTGGREATARHIPGERSLCVGMPLTRSRRGWQWVALSDCAQLESGHTPSRKHPEYWGGSIPWIGIKDARENHGRRIQDTIQKTNKLGVAHSSTRLLPENTVCLSRTASVGYVLVMGAPMCTSQDFVNWVCSDRLEPDFLKYLLCAENRDGLLRFASGSVHQTIYFPEVKAFHICIPDTQEQRRIVQLFDELSAQTKRLESVYERKLDELAALKKSLLHQAYSGEL